MRCALLILAVVLIPFAGCQMIKGSGVPTTIKHTVSDFDSVSFGGSGSVEITVGQPKSVEITIDDNLHENVTVKVKDGQLVVGTQGSWSTTIGLNVKISVPQLNSYHGGGSGDAVIHNVAAEEFEATVSGSGEIQAEGISTTVSATISGSGDIDFSKIAASKANAIISGSGDISVYAKEAVTATIAGSGNISVYGNPPTIVEAISGSGDINRK